MICRECDESVDSVSLHFCPHCGGEFARAISGASLPTPKLSGGAIVGEQLSWSANQFAWGHMAAPLRWTLLADGGFIFACRSQDGIFRLVVASLTTQDQNGVATFGLEPKPNLTLNLGDDVIAAWPRRRGCLVVHGNGAHYYQLNANNWSRVDDLSGRVGNERITAGVVCDDGSLIVATVESETVHGHNRFRIWHERRHLDFFVVGDIDSDDATPPTLLSIVNSTIGSGVGVVTRNGFSLLSLSGVKYGVVTLDSCVFDLGRFGELTRNHVAKNAELLVLAGEKSQSGERFMCAICLKTGEELAFEAEPKDYRERLTSTSGHAGVLIRNGANMLVAAVANQNLAFTTDVATGLAGSHSAISICLRDTTIILCAIGVTGRLELWQNGVVPSLSATVSVTIKGQGAGPVVPFSGVPAMVAQYGAGLGIGPSLFFLANEPNGGQVGWRVIRLKLGEVP